MQDQSVDYSTLLPDTNIDPIIRGWLQEDMPTFDVGGFVVGSSMRKAILYMKSPGVFAGKPFVNSVFRLLNCQVLWSEDAVEGMFMDPKGSKIVLATVEGPAHAILRGEVRK